MTRSSMLLSYFIFLSIGCSVESGGGIRGTRNKNVGNGLLVLGPLLQMQDNVEIRDHGVSSTSNTWIASHHHVHTYMRKYE